MTTKRKTKSQREAEQKAALLQRVHDVYSGAQGSQWNTEINGDFATAEILQDVLCTLQQIFGKQRGYDYYWNIHHLSHFDTPEKAADFLFGEGFRA